MMIRYVQKVYPRMLFFICIAMLLLGLVQEAFGAFTNYINHPIMSCGAEHALMLKADGTVWVWGDDYQHHQFGGAIPPQFGNSYSFWSDGVDYDFNPSRVPGVLGAVAVAAGSYHSLVLKWDGKVMAFGGNYYGQLGLGDQQDKAAATLIPNLSNVVAISCGEGFSMAVLG